jgi:hypothetical protein
MTDAGIAQRSSARNWPSESPPKDATDGLVAAFGRGRVFQSRDAGMRKRESIFPRVVEDSEVAPVIEEGMRLFGLSAQDIDAALTSLLAA